MRPVRTLIRSKVSKVFVLLLTSAGAALALQFLLMRALGAEGYGVYAIVANWVLLGSRVTRLGFDVTAIREVAAWADNGGKDRRTFIPAALATAGTVAIVAGVLLALAGTAATDGQLSVGFRAAIILLPAVTLLSILGGILIGLQKQVASVALSSVFYPLLTSSVIGCAVLIGLPIDPVRALWILAASYTVALGLSALLVRREIGCELRGGVTWRRAVAWARQSSPLVIVSATEGIVARSTLLIVGAMRPEVEAGLFAAALTLATSFKLFLSAVNSVVAPRISQLHSRGMREGIQVIVSQAALGLSLVTGAAAAFLMLFSDTLLTLLGDRYVAASDPLAVLLLAPCLLAFTGPVGFLLSMTGNQASFARMQVVVAGCAIALGLALVPSFGMIGAAWATVLATLVRCALLGWLAFRKVGIFATPAGLLALPAIRAKRSAAVVSPHSSARDEAGC